MEDLVKWLKTILSLNDRKIKECKEDICVLKIDENVFEDYSKAFIHSENVKISDIEEYEIETRIKRIQEALEDSKESYQTEVLKERLKELECIPRIVSVEKILAEKEEKKCQTANQ